MNTLTLTQLHSLIRVSVITLVVGFAIAQQMATWQNQRYADPLDFPVHGWTTTADFQVPPPNTVAIMTSTTATATGLNTTGG